MKSALKVDCDGSTPSYDVYEHRKEIILDPRDNACDLFSKVADLQAENPNSFVDIRYKVDETFVNTGEGECKIARFRDSKRNELAHYTKLPREWQQELLRRCGGTGHETADNLYSALSPCPAYSTDVMTYLDAVDKRCELNWKRRFVAPWINEIIGNVYYLDALDNYHKSERQWENNWKYQKLALEIVERTRGISKIAEAQLRFLAASDDELLEEAHRIALIRRSTNGTIKDGNLLTYHPRECDKGTIRRQLRRGVGLAALWGAGILRLVGGAPALSLPAYSDDWSLERWREKESAAKRFLEEREVVHPSGYRLPLLDIVEASKKSRQSMWYALVLGMEDRATKTGMVPIFVTGTVTARVSRQSKEGKKWIRSSAFAAHRKRRAI